MPVVVCCLSCKDNPPTCPPLEAPSTILLQAIDIGVSDAFIQITTIDTNHFDSLRLLIDGVVSLRIPFRTTDTTVFLDSLLPQRTYTLSASLYSDTVQVAKSNFLTFLTMDTSSHNFTWEVDTLGDGGNSILRDVFIVSDTSVWVVGELHRKDSTGAFDPVTYNAAHWNGREWQYISIQFPECDDNGEVGTAPFQGMAVFGFSDNDIWITDGGHFVHWNGLNFARTCDPARLIQGELLKIWGTSSSKLYAVGRNGTIVQYDGQIWSKMASGTDVDLLDVWGSDDGSDVYACGWEDFKPTVLLKLQNSTWEKVWEDNNPFTMREDSLSGILEFTPFLGHRVKPV